MIDRLGRCSHCNTSWDEGDIYERLSKLDVFTHKDLSDIVKVAESLGWSADQKTRFTKLKVHDKDGVMVLECSTCGMQYDIEGNKLEKVNQ